MSEDYESNFKPHEHEMLIECPQCGTPSPSIKIFRFPIIVYLLLFWFLTTRPTAACPGCQRLNILKYAAINLLTMHVLFIFIYPFVIVYFLIRSTIAGHSSDVSELLDVRK